MGHIFFNTARWDIYSSTLQDGTYILQHCKMGHIFFNIARWDIYSSTLQDGTSFNHLAYASKKAERILTKIIFEQVSLH